MSDTIITEGMAKQLAALIKRYANTQIAMSWKGAQPVSYWDVIEGDAASAAQALEVFISVKLGRKVDL